MKSLIVLLILLLVAACAAAAQDTDYDIDILGSQDCALVVTVDNPSDAALPVSVSQDDVVLQAVSVESGVSVSVTLPIGALSYRFHTDGASVPTIHVSEAEGCVHARPLDASTIPTAAEVPHSRAEALGMTQGEYVTWVIDHIVEPISDVINNGNSR